MTPVRGLVALGGLLAVLGLPAQAAAGTSWQAAVDAQVPADVTLTDVAATPALVVAVGNTAVAGAIHRRVGGRWQADAPPAGVTSVARVALGGTTAWAIGAKGSTPVLLRLEPAADAAATWEAVDGAGTSPLTALAVAPDGSGIAGAQDGSLRDFGPGRGDAVAVDAGPWAPGGRVTALLLAAAKQGFATSTGIARFLELGREAPRVRPSASSAPSAPCSGAPQALAPLGSAAIAVDEHCAWTPQNGVWASTTVDAYSLVADVATTTAGADLVTILVGSSGTAGRVWRRTGGGSFAVEPGGGAAPLNAVAAAGPADVWAVGGQGTVRHYAPEPALPPSGGVDDDPQPAPPTPRQDGNSQSPSRWEGEGRQESTVAVVIDDPNKAPPRRRGSDEPERSTSGPAGSETGGKPGAKGPRRLMVNVVARAVKRKLIVEFDLRAPAVVSITALIGKRTIGATRPRRLGRGHWKLAVPYRGKTPPTNLKITAKRSPTSTTPAAGAARRR